MWCVPGDYFVIGVFVGGFVSWAFGWVGFLGLFFVGFCDLFVGCWFTWFCLRWVGFWGDAIGFGFCF